MTIYYITNEILDDSSVETIHIDEICKQLASLGHAVTLYAPKTDTFSSPHGYRLKSITTPRFLISVWFQVRVFFILRRDIFHHRPDIIYVRNNHLLFVPVLISRFSRIPLVLEMNGKLLDEAEQNFHSIIGRALLTLGVLKMIESLILRSAAQIIVVAPGIKAYALKHYAIDPATITIVHNGVDTAIFQPGTSASARHVVGLGSGVYIAYIGSFYPWQGLRYILKAAQLVLRERPQSKFLIVGSGKEYDYISSFVRQNQLHASIELRPAVPHALIPRYIQAVDICLCYPTRVRAYATSPFKVYEYLACAKPVVVSDIGGIREEFGAAVAYVKPESPRALARVLVALIDNEEERHALGERGRAFIKKGHTWESVAGRISAVCHAALNN